MMGEEGSGMKMHSRYKRLRDAIERIKRFFKREPESPDDPYALVAAPKKPRTPRRSAGAEASLE
ncbi:hypothetical protein SBA3_1560008 [Candidatus Sulfopaludibacter sp. SbA3]|nr:hypothetical protein SBA3_1560008 [Candidatus Sulfopaludibacter sp. SbA3]